MSRRAVLAAVFLLVADVSGFFSSRIRTQSKSCLYSDKIQGEWKKKAALEPSAAGGIGTIPVMFLPEKKQTIEIVGQVLWAATRRVPFV